MSRFDPSNVAFLFFIENVGDAEAKGLDVDFQWAATEGLTLSGAFSILGTELTKLNSQLEGIAVPTGSDLPWRLPSPATCAPATTSGFRAWRGTPIWRPASTTGASRCPAWSAARSSWTTRCSGNPASTPALSSSMREGTYGTVEIPDGAGGTRLPSNSRFVNPSATTFNVAVGLEKDSWMAELFIDNLNNEEAPIMQIAGHYTPAITVQRPRTIGLRVSYDFE